MRDTLTTVAELVGIWCVVVGVAAALGVALAPVALVAAGAGLVAGGWLERPR
jgi:hypothetical protein